MKSIFWVKKLSYIIKTKRYNSPFRKSLTQNQNQEEAVYFKQTPFTQCLSFVGLGNPSPLKTCPK
jgi:hypothetical protein